MERTHPVPLRSRSCGMVLLNGDGTSQASARTQTGSESSLREEGPDAGAVSMGAVRAVMATPTRDAFRERQLISMCPARPDRPTLS